MAWDALAAVRKQFGGKGSAPAATGSAPPETPDEPAADGEAWKAQAEAQARKEYEAYARTNPDAVPWDEYWASYQEGSNRYKAKEREAGLEDASEQLREGGYDEETANRYESEARSEIDPVFYAQSKALASDYARRGLSDSGMSAGGQEDASLRWAAQRRLANERAIDRATGDRRRQILDSAGLDINLLNYDLQRQQLALQQEALDQQNDQDYLGQILGLAGAGIGYATGRPPSPSHAAPVAGQGVEPALQLQVDPLTGEQVFVDPYTGTRY